MPDRVEEIRVLPQDVANQIAAGEVVERPASVVKELLENAVDAEATAITVEIKEGGVKYIRITDNGKGIPSSQLGTAFLRHATSKIQQAQHLGSIATLGFRGEALAAIASVSKIQVISTVEQGGLGHSLYLEGGILQKEEEIGASKGTTMVVEDLFYNTPARKKFLKSLRSESTAIFSLVQQLALSQPGISIKFIREGKEELKTPGDGKLETVVFHVLGKNIASGLRFLSLEDRSSRVEGFVSLPSCCRASRSYQHFFVNGRYIKSPMLVTAVEEAYKNQKMVGRFPSAVLHLHLPFDELDVNVHPAKTQVKFAYEKEVFQLVYRCVLQGLGAHRDIQRVELSDNTTSSNLLPPKETVPALPEQKVAEEIPASKPQPWEGSPSSGKGIPARVESAPSQGMSPIAEPFVDVSGEKQENIPKNKKELPKIDYNFSNLSGYLQDDEEEPWQQEASLAVQGEKSLVSQEGVEKSLVKEEKQENYVEYEEIPLENYQGEPAWRVVGEFFQTYIAVEVGDEIYLVDKHAAHERMNFDRMKSQNYTPMSQVLLKPVVVAVSPQEQTVLLENLELLREFSFDVEEFSPQSVIVREAPYDLLPENIPATLLELVEKWELGDSPDPGATRDHLLHSIACKSAIRAGDHTWEEEQQILAKIIMEDKVRHCPHGRPIVASLSKKDLEKKFKRIL